MSWQPYVDDNLIKSGTVDKAAIYSVAGDSKWAGSPAFEAKPAELQEIISALGGKTDKVYAEGLHFGGEKYVLNKVEDGRSLYARKGKDGVIIVKTTLALLVAHYNETMQAGSCAITVEALADYLIKSGY